MKNKEDVYSKFASKIYSQVITKENKQERALGKAAVLGLGYCAAKLGFKLGQIDTIRKVLELPEISNHLKSLREEG